MNCDKCKKKPAQLDYIEQKLCRNCYAKLIEKRVRKYIRVNEFFQKDDRLLIIGELCKYLIDRILENRPIVKFYAADVKEPFASKKVKALVKKHKINKIVIPWTLDREAHYFLENFFDKKVKMRYLGDVKGYVKLLRPLTDKEAANFAAIKKVTFNPLKADSITKMLESLEQKYPSVRHGLGHSMDEFAKIMNKSH